MSQSFWIYFGIYFIGWIIWAFVVYLFLDEDEEAGWLFAGGLWPIFVPAIIFLTPIVSAALLARELRSKINAKKSA